MNIQRIGAIFEKDIKDFMKNMTLIIMPIVPILMALFYIRLGGGESLPLFMIYIIVGLTYTMVTTSCIMTMIAEENEKNTLRGLIQSPASFFDILIGKSLVTGLMTLVSLGASLIIVGIEPFLHVRAIIGLILLFLFFLFLGIGIGLFAKSMASTSAYIMPIMFLLGLTPMVKLIHLAEDSPVLLIADAFPLPQLIAMHESNSWLPIGIVALWTLGAALFTYVCFLKRKTDD